MTITSDLECSQYRLVDEEKRGVEFGMREVGSYTHHETLGFLMFLAVVRLT